MQEKRNCSSKLTEFADNNFKFDENCRKFSKWIKTLWEKEKLLITSKFLLFPQCFQKTLLQTHKIQGLFWKGLYPCSQCTLYKSCFHRVLFTSTQHNSFQATSAFPHNNRPNNEQQWNRNESSRNNYHQSLEEYWLH